MERNRYIGTPYEYWNEYSELTQRESKIAALLYIYSGNMGRDNAVIIRIATELGVRQGVVFGTYAKLVSLGIISFDIHEEDLAFLESLEVCTEGNS